MSDRVTAFVILAAALGAAVLFCGFNWPALRPVALFWLALTVVGLAWVWAATRNYRF